METREIEKSLWLQAPAAEVFDLLLDSRGHSLFTGMNAEVSREIGAEFRIGNEQATITGQNQLLELNRRIEQSWRITVDGWPSDHWSRLTLSFAERDGGTELSMRHELVPAICVTPMINGWDRFYWQPLQRYCEAKK